MALFDNIESLSTVPRAICSVTRIRGELSDEDAAGLDAALANGNVQGTTIARLLSENGHRVSSNSVSRHRRGDCRCGA